MRSTATSMSYTAPSVSEEITSCSQQPFGASRAKIATGRSSVRWGRSQKSAACTFGSLRPQTLLKMPLAHPDVFAARHQAHGFRKLQQAAGHLLPQAAEARSSKGRPSSDASLINLDASTSRLMRMRLMRRRAPTNKKREIIVCASRRHKQRDKNGK